MSEQPFIRCPTCNEMFRAEPSSHFMPFCSPRCQSVDLHRWMNHEIGLPHCSSDEEEAATGSAEMQREWRFDDDEVDVDEDYEE